MGAAQIYSVPFFMENCLICNKKFKPTRHSLGKYCSVKCSGKSRIGNTFRAGIPAWNKGIKGIHLSPKSEFKQQPIPTKNCEQCSKEFGKPYGFNKGRWIKVRFCSTECSSKGNSSWKGGITPINTKIRNSNKFIEWAKYIKQRDNFECQICGEIGGKLRSNHIRKFADYPDLRFDSTNGITICTRCDYKWVFSREKEWESYFNFNLKTRGYLNG
jgi:hypothetical protein